ncbi:hypothetical protein [Nocardioides sp.]|uniref:hypothetical protein n=1 Tax=Nocardioides sp. TaxID=35761 RepID=UPI00260CE952|nr:hypothetical protein [Nocardioides sp.]MCW2736697.1 hypothetical protein [Nocardioides sp.]
MSTYEATAIYRSMLADRMRDAEQRRLAREVKQTEAQRVSRPVATSPRRHSRVWRLVYFPHANG